MLLALIFGALVFAAISWGLLLLLGVTTQERKPGLVGFALFAHLIGVVSSAAIFSTVSGLSVAERIVLPIIFGIGGGAGSISALANNLWIVDNTSFGKLNVLLFKATPGIAKASQQRPLIWLLPLFTPRTEWENRE